MSLIYTSPVVGGSTSRVGVGVRGKKNHGLYIGGKADAKSRTKLDQLGVTHILNVTPEKEACIQSGVPNYFERDRTLTYKRVPVYDSSTSDLLSRADEIVGFISTGLHHGSVLVHCKMGASRSATCVIFFLIRKLGMSYDRAFAHCLRRRPCVNPIPAFVVQMRKYEAKCRKMGLIGDFVGDGGGGEQQPKKRKSPAGPCIGPARGPLQGPSIGPARGPVQGPSIGPARGPVQGPSIGPAQGPVQGPPIGPALPPGPLDSVYGALDDFPKKKKAKRAVHSDEADVSGPVVGPAITPVICPAIGPVIGPAVGPNCVLDNGPSIGTSFGSTFCSARESQMASPNRTERVSESKHASVLETQESVENGAHACASTTPEVVSLRIESAGVEPKEEGKST